MFGAAPRVATLILLTGALGVGLSGTASAQPDVGICQVGVVSPCNDPAYWY